MFTKHSNRGGCLAIEVALVSTSAGPVYQEVAQRAKQLRRLGLSDAQVARGPGTTNKTVRKAIE